MRAYEVPAVGVVPAGELAASAASLASSGDDGETEVLPTLAETLYQNFAIGAAGLNGSARNQDGALDVCKLIESLWVAIHNKYASEGNGYCSWLFFRSLGSTCYMNIEELELIDAAWQAVAGAFTSLDQFCKDQLGLGELFAQVIASAVGNGHARNDGIDFGHFCITAATHLAVELGLSTAASCVALLPLSQYDLAEGKGLKACAGWLGDASIVGDDGEISMEECDAKADMDALRITEINILSEGWGAAYSIRKYYYSGLVNRYSGFRGLLGLSKDDVVGAIFELLVMQGNESADVLNQSRAAKELILKDRYSQAYDNFYAKI